VDRYKKYNDYELLYLLSWHSDEALDILLNKYECLVITKLHKFHVAYYHFDDIKQECMLTLLKAFKTYDDRYGKTFTRYAELLIDRRIIKSLKEDVKYSETIILNEELDRPAIEISVYEAISYEKVLKDLREVEFTGLKKLILNEIFVNEMSIKDFCSKYNVNSKDVYNHIYIIRSKLKQRFNDY